MTRNGEHRKYICFDESKGFPAGPKLYYMCLICGETLPSIAADATYCDCRNVMFDIGRIKIQDISKVRLFETDDSP